MKLKLKNGMIAVAACLSFSQVIADPASLDSVTYDADTSTVTVHGSGFGSGPNVFLFDGFESGTASSGDDVELTASIKGAWTDYGTNSPRYDNRAHSGNYSALIYDKDTEDMLQVKAQFPTGVQDIYVSSWVRIPNGTFFPGMNTTAPEQFPSDSSWKFNWLIDQDYIGNSSDIILPSHTGFGKFAIGGNDGLIDYLSTNNWWSWTSWNRMSTLLKSNETDPTDTGLIVFSAMSSEHGAFEEVINKPVFDSDGPALKQFQSINFPGWLRPSGTNNVQPLYDDIYIATGENAAVRIEIADASVYSAASESAIQLAETWTDTKIVFKLREGGLTNVDQAYIHVFNSNNEPVSTIKFCDSCKAFPKPPNFRL